MMRNIFVTFQKEGIHKWPAACEIEGIDKEICMFDNVKGLAKIHQTISYEILCRIDSNIERRII